MPAALPAVLVLVTSAAFLDGVEAGPKLYVQTESGGFERIAAADVCTREAAAPGTVEPIYIRKGDDYLRVDAAWVLQNRVGLHERRVAWDAMNAEAAAAAGELAEAASAAEVATPEAAPEAAPAPEVLTPPAPVAPAASAKSTRNRKKTP